MMSDRPQDHCRIFGVSAPAAPIVVLLRRGPTRWVQLVQWHTDTDTIVDGQWLRGHIYQRRCSLSPDGQLFAYFVSKYGLRLLHAESTETWTAISRPPYFTALALWPKGDSWNGGGVFQDQRTLLLNHPEGKAMQPPPADRLRVVAGHAIPWFAQGEDQPIYSAILKQQGWHRIKVSHDDINTDYLFRDEETTESLYALDPYEGWFPVEALRYIETPEQMRQRLPALPKGKQRKRQISATANVWQKADPTRWFLLQQVHYGWDASRYGSPYIVDWQVYDRGVGQAQHIEQAEWADWDQRGRLIFTRQGQVWACLPEQYPQGAVCLADLNDRRPKSTPSPDWARQWP